MINYVSIKKIPSSRDNRQLSEMFMSTESYIPVITTLNTSIIAGFHVHTLLVVSPHKDMEIACMGRCAMNTQTGINYEKNWNPAIYRLASFFSSFVSLMTHSAQNGVDDRRFLWLNLMC